MQRLSTFQYKQKPERQHDAFLTRAFFFRPLDPRSEEKKTRNLFSNFPVVLVLGSGMTRPLSLFAIY